VTQFTDRRGKVTTFSYDALNRKTFAGFGTQAGPTYESTVTYSYDAGNRLTQAVDSVTGTITRGYDSLDRLTSETTPQGTVSYTYDAAGRRASMTVAGQPAVSYAYDNANRLVQIAQGTSTVGFGYDAASRRSTLTLPNGVVMSYSYDSASQLTGLTYTLGSNALGNLTYAYDLAGRGINVGGSFARTGLPLAVSTTAYNANNQLTQWGTANLFYDPNGNMTSDGVNSFVWNARNQLASMNLGSVSFQYDPFGRRVGKTISGTTTNYVYDGANTVQELSGGAPTANLLSGGVDEVFTRADAVGARNFLTDALGGTLALSDATGTLQTQYTYEPFGNTTASGLGSANPFQYTGRENDGTGLYFYRARYYSPTLQRFISEDPLDLGGGDLNLYAYVRNSPTNFTDSSGMIGPLFPFPIPLPLPLRKPLPLPNPLPGRKNPPQNPAQNPSCGGNDPQKDCDADFSRCIDRVFREVQACQERVYKFVKACAIACGPICAAQPEACFPCVTACIGAAAAGAQACGVIRTGGLINCGVQWMQCRGYL